MLALFSVALLVGAALMFAVQPMVARLVLPLFGGAPAVWNTCVLFFQAALLAGYAYAHWAPRYLGLRRHAFIHLVLLACAALLLPFAVSPDWAPPAEAPPALWLLWLLLVAVGLPFFVLSATAPLVQKWFAATAHASARDPYFLYVASNLGSMIALLGYPFILEPTLTLNQQGWLWLAGYLVLIVLLVASAAFLLLSQRQSPSGDSPPVQASADAVPNSSPTWLLRIKWLALAFVPSSLMLSVTTYLTTDIAAFPLFWVTPLALYLLTFILAFARKPLFPNHLVQRYGVPLAVLLLTLVLLSEATEPIWLLLLLHLAGLFIVALACHGELANTRPDVAHLTEFYLWLSLGGVLGGAFNALLAPVLFVTVTEYPLVLILACLLRPAPTPDKKAMSTPTMASKQSAQRAARSPAAPNSSADWKTRVRLDVLPAVLLGALALVLALVGGWLLKPSEPATFQMLVGIAFGVPAVICYTFLERPWRFGFGIAALFFAGIFTEGIHGRRIYAERSFFGIHRITRDEAGQFVRLIHGNTIHGQQSSRADLALEPLTYYHRGGPIGKVLHTLDKGKFPLKKIAVIGLGVGSLAAYGKPDQEWTFYEIDPVVEKIACHLSIFTYWKNCEAIKTVVLGDARLKLQETRGAKYDLLIIDAFNSDAVPVHLLTREALQVYLDRLSTNGVIAFHISNRYLDLEPVVAEIAADANLEGLSHFAIEVTGEEKLQGKFPSHWVVMSKSQAVLDAIRATGSWHDLKGGNPQYLWTDQFSNILSVIRWSNPL